MSAPSSGAATLPKGFRLHHSDLGDPKTPEPFLTAESDIQPPSPPRPRFRLKRRHVSQLTAPTQQFLASVAAADVPIPSIEEPELGAPVEDSISETTQFPTPLLRIPGDSITSQKLRNTALSPPKTPVPEVAPSLSPRQYPDWTIDSAFSSSESSPECEDSRPSTARSTHTSASLFSRISITSEDCMSPEFEKVDGLFQPKTEDVADVPIASSSNFKGKMRKAPWTRAMSDHLWNIYLMYCQDPKVTPFRPSRNGIPPHGVCLRVAREAKRSWKGSKAHLTVEDKSGSTTPTVEAPAAYIQWPHTCAATRARLHEMCRAKSASSAARTSQYLSHSPTPFGRTITRHWNRRTTPFPSSSVFSPRDMNISLTMSTAESMQPTGPLAQLTGSDPEPLPADECPTAEPVHSPPDFALQIPDGPPRRLGSPFTTRTYGPSSSNTLASGFSFPSSIPPRQTNTFEPRRSLQSPARLTRSRSNTLQKRKSRQAANEARRYKRPSLGSDLWAAPSAVLGGASVGEGSESSGARAELEFSSTDSRRNDELFIPRTNLEELFRTRDSMDGAMQSSLAHLDLPITHPPRLGSPFAVSSSSLSFPNRLSQPDNLFLDDVRRPFATVQQPAEDPATSSRANLASRLSYINERLREFRQRDLTRRRSESPL